MLKNNIWGFVTVEYGLVAINFIIFLLLVDYIGFRYWQIALVMFPINFIVKYFGFRKVFKNEP